MFAGVFAEDLCQCVNLGKLWQRFDRVTCSESGIQMCPTGYECNTSESVPGDEWESLCRLPGCGGHTCKDITIDKLTLQKNGHWEEEDTALALSGTLGVTAPRETIVGCDTTITAKVGETVAIDIEWTTNDSCNGCTKQLYAGAIAVEQDEDGKHNGLLHCVDSGRSYSWAVQKFCFAHKFDKPGEYNLLLSCSHDDNCDTAIDKELYWGGMTRLATVTVEECDRPDGCDSPFSGCYRRRRPVIRCEPECHESPLSWYNICRMDKCWGCTGCASCPDYCQESPLPWENKCRWGSKKEPKALGCAGCNECQELPYVCKPWCKTRDLPWTTKCLQHDTCAGCEECRDPALLL